MIILISILGILLVLVLLARHRKNTPDPPVQVPKKIPAVILEYERNKKIKEENRKIKIQGIFFFF